MTAARGQLGTAFGRGRASNMLAKRGREMHHHIRGLLLAARGRDNAKARLAGLTTARPETQ